MGKTVKRLSSHQNAPLLSENGIIYAMITDGIFMRKNYINVWISYIKYSIIHKDQGV